MCTWVIHLEWNCWVTWWPFEALPHCVPKWLTTVHPDQQCSRGWLLHLLTTACCYLSFWLWSSWWVWSGILFFIICLLSWVMMWGLYHVLVGHFYVFLGHISVQILCSFLNWGFVLLLLTCKNSSDRNPLSDTFDENLTHPVGYLLHLVIVSIQVWKWYILMETLFVLVLVLLVSHLRRVCLCWGHGTLCLCLLLRVLILSALRFRSLIHFE